ncbi:hypothetical protein HYW87_05150, partial [Candidatus Roizmanbacteria bacterium]|nr:hypothetical protein [Candidatus Roizmanbacteria bacterium]
LLGLFFYSLYLFKTTGDPLFFLNSQWAFGANRASSLILLPQVYFRYFKIFLTANWNFQYFIALLEFVTFSFVFIVLLYDLNKTWQEKLRTKAGTYERLGLTLFSLINLILPTFTGTFSSIPRYALFSLSFFLVLSKNKNNLIRIVLLLIFFLFHILTLGFFAQGYFVS